MVIAVVIGVGLVMMTASSAISIASAQQPQTSGSKSGTIASIQNDENGKPAWILSGGWDFKNIDSGSPTFNSTFHMIKLDGSEPHMHHIKDFKMTGSPTKSATAITYNGTATIVMKGMPMSNVPISIKLTGHAMSLWMDPNKVMNHFGNTPIYGFVG